MADKHDKFVTPKHVALSVLQKVGELLEKSEIAKSGSYSIDPAPEDPNTVKKCETCGTMSKAEDKHECKPMDKSEVAVLEESLGKLLKTLGQDKLAKSENYSKPTPAKGQGDTLTPDKTKIDYQLNKYEDENSKKLGYKTSEAGNKEREPEASDKAFNVEDKDHKSSDDQRLNSQTNPHENAKEQAEGNNELAGTTPTQVGQDGKNKPGYDEQKSHLKLAKFIGRMEYKRTRALQGTQSQTDSNAQHAQSIKDKSNG
jgi:hypothetical protein